MYNNININNLCSILILNLHDEKKRTNCSNCGNEKEMGNNQEQNQNLVTSKCARDGNDCMQSSFSKMTHLEMDTIKMGIETRKNNSLNE